MKIVDEHLKLLEREINRLIDGIAVSLDLIKNHKNTIENYHDEIDTDTLKKFNRTIDSYNEAIKSAHESINELKNECKSLKNGEKVSSKEEISKLQKENDPLNEDESDTPITKKPNRYYKGQWVKHPKLLDWGRGVVLADSDEKKVEVTFENVGKKTVSLEHVQLKVVNDEIASKEEIKKLLARDRIYVGEKLREIYDDLKSIHHNALIIIECGSYYTLLEDDALFLQKTKNYQIYDQSSVSMGTGFPTKNLDIRLAEFRKLGKPYVVVSQLPNKNPMKFDVERKVTEVFK